MTTCTAKPIPPPPSWRGTHHVEIDDASPDCLRSDSLATITPLALAHRSATASMTSDEHHISRKTLFCMSAPRSWK